MLLFKQTNIKTYAAPLAWKSLAGLLYLFLAMAQATTLSGISYNTLQKDQIELVFSLSEQLKTKPNIVTALDPARIDISFDASAFDLNLAQTLVGHANVKNIEVKQVADQVVASVYLTKLSIFNMKQQGSQFSLLLNNASPSDAASSDAASSDEVKQQGALSQDFINNIQSIDFGLGENSESQIFVALDANMVAVDVSEKLGKIYVEFYNTQILEGLLYKLDVTDFGTIVTGIETFKESRNARLVIDVNGKFTFKHQQLNNIFTLTVSEKIEPANDLVAIENFTGGAISLNFQDISVRTVLQIIADYNDFNLITSDSVVGNVTLRLDGVPWDQALDMILKIKGLDKRMLGNILMVAPSDELAAREARDLQAKQQVADLAPLYSEYVQINYAKAINLAALIKGEESSVLSARGSVSVDERTNTLLIRDTAKSIEDLRRMVSILDVPVRQVVIEARMVTVKDNINEELGIRWGVTNNSSDYAGSGNLTGANAAANGVVPALSDRLNVNLPIGNPAGSLAFQVARLADGTILDLELSALEKENKGEIIASPRITTANQKEAYIEQGVEIPYQEASSSGATSTQFKKAVLSLTVTPHITPDDRIILDLVVTQDTISDVQSGSAPGIDTQRIGTQVLVNNGETIVLGGVYQQQTISSVSKVPILGDIPYFGWLFRNSSNFNEKKELLIFVTPRVVKENL
jgi:type IV pilus assembly protein PilQ